MQSFQYVICMRVQGPQSTKPLILTLGGR